jgi:hypothetical protein
MKLIIVVYILSNFSEKINDPFEILKMLGSTL